MIPDGTLGGYIAKHQRPPAFEGSDGSSYSVDLYIDDGDADSPDVGAALLFVRWSADGAQPVGHLETDFLARGRNRDEVRQALHGMTLHEIKEHLERLIQERRDLPPW